MGDLGADHEVGKRFRVRLRFLIVRGFRSLPLDHLDAAARVLGVVRALVDVDDGLDVLLHGTKDSSVDLVHS